MNVFKKVNGYETANKSLFPLIVKKQFSERCHAFFPKKDSRKSFRK